MGRARVMRVPGADANADAGGRTYLVLAKPNVIMNDIRLQGSRLQEVRSPVGKGPTTMPRPLATSNAPSAMRPLGPG
jgi:hypothetical protein